MKATAAMATTTQRRKAAVSAAAGEVTCVRGGGVGKGSGGEVASVHGGDSGGSGGGDGGWEEAANERDGQSMVMVGVLVGVVGLERHQNSLR